MTISASIRASTIRLSQIWPPPCNAIAPTFVKTQMLTEQVSAERQAELRLKIPVGRFCELEEFSHCVLFLAHPMSGFITGEVLDLNGGIQFD